MVDVVDSIIHDLILQLVKSDKAYQDSGISRLLPIETVYKGYGLHNGVLKIPFDPYTGPGCYFGDSQYCD